MIKNVADLLDSILAVERRVLDREAVKHPTIVGGMYETLTREVLLKALPEHIGLKVVEGFAIDQEGRRSNQIDCMLVVGDQGRQLPRSASWEYPVDDVLVVIEVKKNLYRKEIGQGYENLRSLLPLSRTNAPEVGQSLRRSFQGITRRPFPAALDDLSPSLRAIYDVLASDAENPVRVLLGYHGFSSETGLRGGVLAELDSRVGQEGSGPLSLPSLILNRNAVVAKTNGMPWHPMTGDVADRWPILMSSTHPPALALLEVIWTRLNHRGLLDASWFGDDREIEQWHLLIAVEFDDVAGAWRCQSLGKEVPNTPAATRRWEPIAISEQQYIVLMVLKEQDSISVSDLPAEPRRRMEALKAIDGLVESGILGPDATKADTWGYLTINCAAVLMPDGTAFAGDNSSGRFMRWATEYIAASKAEG